MIRKNQLVQLQTIKLRKTTVPMHLQQQFQTVVNSMHQDMLNVTKPEENKANAKSDQQGKVNKPKQQAKTLPDTGMSHNDDLPYAELALGAGMAFLIRRFTKKDQQTEE